MVPPLAFLRSFLAFSQARRVTMCLDQGRDTSDTALEWTTEAAEEQEIYAVKYIAVLVPNTSATSFSSFVRPAF